LLESIGCTFLENTWTGAYSIPGKKKSHPILTSEIFGLTPLLFVLSTALTNKHKIMSYNRRTETNNNGRKYYQNDETDEEATQCSMKNAVVDMVLNQDEEEHHQQVQQEYDDEKAQERAQLENYHKNLAQQRRGDITKMKATTTTRTSSTRQIGIGKKNYKKIHPMATTTNTATTVASTTQQQQQQHRRGQSSSRRKLNLVDISVPDDDPSLHKERVGVTHQPNSSSLHKMTSDEEKMLKAKIAGILGNANNIPDAKDQLSVSHVDEKSSPSRSTSAPPDILRRDAGAVAAGDDDEMTPPSLRRHAQSLPGAVRVRGPGYIEDGAPDETNSIVSQIVASVTRATRGESERYPNENNSSNSSHGSDDDERDEENLINAVLVDTDEFVEATIMPEPRKRRCRTILCSLMVIGIAIVLAGILPLVYDKLKSGATISSNDDSDTSTVVVEETDKDVGSDFDVQTLSPSSTATASEKSNAAQEQFPSLSPSVTSEPTVTASNVPTIAPTTAAPSTIPSVTPTTSPTASVTIAVVIQLDDHPEQTGWSLKCDDKTYFHIPPMTYENDQNRQIVVLGETYLGANCILGIIDTGFDGISDGSYEVYYGNDITDPANRLVDGWGSSFEKELKAPFVVAAPPTMSPTTSMAPSASPAPTIDPGFGLPAINLVPVTVEIQLDYFSSEISWALQCDGQTVASHAAGSYTTPNELVRETFEVQEGQECKFGILDNYGDGICCIYGDGYYSIKVGNDITNDDNVVVSGTLYVGVKQREESFTVMEPITSGNLFSPSSNPVPP